MSMPGKTLDLAKPAPGEIDSYKASPAIFQAICGFHAGADRVARHVARWTRELALAWDAVPAAVRSDDTGE